MSFDNRIPAQPLSPAGDDPDWLVVSLVDPEGSGADAAFTDGLHGFGLPELLLWARPTHGDDPGADWLLTHEDRLVALEQWAFDLLDGSLHPGDTRQQSFDHGHTTVSFRFGPPAPAQLAGAHQLPGDRPVVVVTWSLTRRTRPAPVDPASPALRRVNRWITRAEAITANWGRQHQRRSGVAEPISASRFGPMADWVAARAEQFCAAGQPVLADFFDRIPAVSLVRCEHCVHEELLFLASGRGRGGAAREASNTADLLTMAITDDPDARLGGAAPGSAACTAWQAEVHRITRCVPQRDHDEVHRAMRHRLRQSIESVLLAAVVADLAPMPLMASACGAWEWAVHGGRVPGRAWLAPAGARAITRDLLTRRGAAQALVPLLRRYPGVRWGSAFTSEHRLTSRDLRAVPDPFSGADQLVVTQAPGLGPGCADGPGPGDGLGLAPPGERAVRLIRGLQTVAAGSARPGWLSGGQLGLARRDARQLEELASPLLTAIAQPTQLHPDTWQQLTGPLRPYLPCLPDQPPGEQHPAAELL